jgi:serine kinase of HPr protein (carbohydrate metabolism regulator)
MDEVESAVEELQVDYSTALTCEPKTGFIAPLDMTAIYDFESKIDEVTRVNNITGGFYMQEFLKAINVASSYHARAIYQYESSQAATKATTGRIMIDQAPAALLARGLRVNADLLVAYTNSNPEVVQAREVEAYNKALVEFLKRKVEKFERAHDDARSLYKGSRDPVGQSPAIQSGKD